MKGSVASMARNPDGDRVAPATRVPGGGLYSREPRCSGASSSRLERWFHPLVGVLWVITTVHSHPITIALKGARDVPQCQAA